MSTFVTVTTFVSFPLIELPQVIRQVTVHWMMVGDLLTRCENRIDDVTGLLNLGLEFFHDQTIGLTDLTMCVCKVRAQASRSA